MVRSRSYYSRCGSSSAASSLLPRMAPVSRLRVKGLDVRLVFNMHTSVNNGVHFIMSFPELREMSDESLDIQDVGRLFEP